MKICTEQKEAGSWRQSGHRASCCGALTLYCLILLSYTISSYAQPQYPILKKRTGNAPINQLSEEYMPVIGVWNMREKELSPEEFKKTLDAAGDHSPFN